MVRRAAGRGRFAQVIARAPSGQRRRRRRHARVLASIKGAVQGASVAAGPAAATALAPRCASSAQAAAAARAGPVRELELTVSDLSDPAAADNIADLFQGDRRPGAARTLTPAAPPTASRVKVTTTIGDAEPAGPLLTFQCARGRAPAPLGARLRASHEAAPGAPPGVPRRRPNGGYGFFAHAPAHGFDRPAHRYHGGSARGQAGGHARSPRPKGPRPKAGAALRFRPRLAASRSRKVTRLINLGRPNWSHHPAMLAQNRRASDACAAPAASPRV